jgi:hypothetical protein
MSDASDNFENDLAKLFFQAINWANVADDAASAPITNWEMSLHSASPGDAGDQTTNEIGYTGYNREPVARTSGGWSVTGGVASLVSNLDFDPGTGGSGTATHMGLGNANTGTGRLQLYGTVTPNIVCGDGVTPRLTTSTQFEIQ